MGKTSFGNLLRHVRLLAVDVDGVLTDAGMYYGPSGEVMKKFNTRDGLGIGLLHEAGVAVAFITGETTPIVQARAAKLKVKHVFQGAADKGAVLAQLQESLDVLPDETAYVGDDRNDLPVRPVAGLVFAVRDACAELREVADCILERRGGEGAVREVADMILGARRPGP